MDKNPCGLEHCACEDRAFEDNLGYEDYLMQKGKLQMACKQKIERIILEKTNGMATD